MKFIDCFTIDIGMFSQPAALPDWNWFAIAIISSYVAKIRKIDWLKVPDKKTVCEICWFVFPFSRFGPMLEKYWQKEYDKMDIINVTFLCAYALIYISEECRLQSCLNSNDLFPGKNTRDALFFMKTLINLYVPSYTVLDTELIFLMSKWKGLW